MDQIDGSPGLFILAQGLFMHFGAFVARVPRLEIVEASLYPKVFPARHRLWSLLAGLPWLSDNGSMLVHARFR
jgi:hypothetical protein